MRKHIIKLLKPPFRTKSLISSSKKKALILNWRMIQSSTNLVESVRSICLTTMHRMLKMPIMLTKYSYFGDYMATLQY